MGERFAVKFEGPFEQHEVIVHGRRVPYLHAQLHDKGQVTLVLGDRFGLELTTEEAERVVPFLADAIAIASGYTCHPTADMEPLRSDPFARTVTVDLGSEGE